MNKTTIEKLAEQLHVLYAVGAVIALVVSLGASYFAPPPSMENETEKILQWKRPTTIEFIDIEL